MSRYQKRPIDPDTEAWIVAEVESGRKRAVDIIRELGVQSERVACILRAHGLRFRGPQLGWQRRKRLEVR